MSLLPITLYGDKILRKKAAKVNNIDNKIIELIKNMFETMRNANGIGLAATQVGADKSIFVIDISKVEGYENVKPMTIINPKIVEYSEEKISMEEGCLSIPELRAEVFRPKQIKLDYQDADLNSQSLEADEILARVLQHEYDHLRGILYTDLVDGETKKAFKKPLEKISKRKIETEYPISDSSDYRIIL